MGETNSTGKAAHLTAQSPSTFSVAANDLQLQLNGLPAPTSAMLIASRSFGLVIHPVVGGTTSQGTLCISGSTIVRFNRPQDPIFATNTNELRSVDLQSIPWPVVPYSTAVVAGETWMWQFWYRDGMSNNFSDALQITFQP